jgi:spore germination protein GerM
VTRHIRLVAAVVFAFALGGCGVPTERDPRPISVPTGSESGSGTATPDGGAGTESGPVEEVLYFVRDGRLVAVRRPVERMPEPQKHLEHLAAGPTDAEHDQGLSSALTGLGTTAKLRIETVTAVVDLGVQPDSAGRSDEVLAYGQIVCTLTARPEIDSVSFHYDGEPVDVPRGDASLGRQPLTAADYRSLLAPS